MTPEEEAVAALRLAHERAEDVMEDVTMLGLPADNAGVLGIATVMEQVRDACARVLRRYGVEPP